MKHMKRSAISCCFLLVDIICTEICYILGLFLSQIIRILIRILIIFSAKKNVGQRCVYVLGVLDNE